MFLKNELTRLKALYETIEKVELEAFLDDQDIKTIKLEAEYLYTKGKQQSTAQQPHNNGTTNAPQQHSNSTTTAQQPYSNRTTTAQQPMAYLNLTNRVIIPRDSNRHCTVTVQRLHSGYDFGKWIYKVAESITFSERTEINIGFSFISWKPHTNERTYLFSAKALAPFQFVVDNKKQCLSHFDEIAKLNDSDILNKTFLNTISDNPFSTSGFCPLKIVCSYIYITK